MRAVLCTLAASSDAARLGVSVAIESGNDATEEPNEASCDELALSLMEWLVRLPAEAVSGKSNLEHMHTGMGLKFLRIECRCSSVCPGKPLIYHITVSWMLDMLHQSASTYAD